MITVGIETESNVLVTPSTLRQEIEAALSEVKCKPHLVDIHVKQIPIYSWWKFRFGTKYSIKIVVDLDTDSLEMPQEATTNIIGILERKYW